MTGTFEINITTASQLLAEWSLIAKSIAQQCKWRPKGQCLVTCQGLAICNLDGLTLVDAHGQPVASNAAGIPRGAGVSACEPYKRENPCSKP